MPNLIKRKSNDSPNLSIIHKKKRRSVLFANEISSNAEDDDANLNQGLDVMPSSVFDSSNEDANDDSGESTPHKTLGPAMTPVQEPPSPKDHEESKDTLSGTSIHHVDNPGSYSESLNDKDQYIPAAELHRRPDHHDEASPSLSAGDGDATNDLISTRPTRLSAGSSPISRTPFNDSKFLEVGPENSEELRRLSIISQLTMELEADRMDDDFLAGRHVNTYLNQETKGEDEEDSSSKNSPNDHAASASNTSGPSNRSSMLFYLQSASQRFNTLAIGKSIQSWKTQRKIYQDDYPRTVAVIQQACWYLGTFYITHVWSTTNRILQITSAGPQFALFLIHSWFDPFQGFLNYCVYQRPRYLFIRKSMPEIGRFGASIRVLKFSFQKQNELNENRRAMAVVARDATSPEGKRRPATQHHRQQGGRSSGNEYQQRKRRSSSSMLGLSRNSIVSSVRQLNASSVVNSVVIEDDDENERGSNGGDESVSSNHRSGNGLHESTSDFKNTVPFDGDGENTDTATGEVRAGLPQKHVISSEQSIAVSNPSSSEAVVVSYATSNDGDNEDDSISIHSIGTDRRTFWNSWPSRRKMDDEEDDDDNRIVMHSSSYNQNMESFGALSIGLEDEILPMDSLAERKINGKP